MGLAYVLFPDQTHRNDPAIGIDEGLAGEGFKHEYPLGMVPQRAGCGVLARIAVDWSNPWCSGR